jgi:hypothetical protein
LRLVYSRKKKTQCFLSFISLRLRVRETPTDIIWQMETEARNRCATCRKDRASVKCFGCSEDFCSEHMIIHREMFNTQLGHIETARDRCRQAIKDQKANPPTHPLLQQINQWECDAIAKIQQTAAEARQTLLEHTVDHVRLLEVDLSKLTNQLSRGRAQNVFHEIHLQEWTEQLRWLSEKTEKPANIYLREDSKSRFINKIHVDARSCEYRCLIEFASS